MLVLVINLGNVKAPDVRLITVFNAVDVSRAVLLKGVAAKCAKNGKH